MLCGHIENNKERRIYEVYMDDEIVIFESLFKLTKSGLKTCFLAWKAWSWCCVFAACEQRKCGAVEGTVEGASYCTFWQ